MKLLGFSNDCFFSCLFCEHAEIFPEFFEVELKREQRIRAKGLDVIVDTLIFGPGERLNWKGVLQIINILDIADQLTIEFDPINFVFFDRKVVQHHIDQVFPKFRHPIALIYQISKLANQVT